MFQPTNSINDVVLSVNAPSHSVRCISFWCWKINLNIAILSYSRLTNHIHLLIHLWLGCHVSLSSSLRKRLSYWTRILIWRHLVCLASTDVHRRKLYLILGIDRSVLSLLINKGLFLLSQHAFSLLVAVGNAIGSSCILRCWFKCH